MKRMLKLVVIITLFIAAFLLFIDTALAWEPFPIPTFVLDLTVNIPDPNLNEALHTVTGVSMSDDIHQSDLYGLSGVLDLSNKNIANLEGIQYCRNVTKLHLTNNPITSFPVMSVMTELDNLYLNSCGLSTYPSGKLPNGLTNLDLSENSLSSLPSEMSGLIQLKTLDLHENNFNAFPDVLYGLSGLEAIHLGENNIGSISPHISGMTSLETLILDNNKLESLPDEICHLPVLLELSVMQNRLYSLPGDIGYSHIYAINVAVNRISSLPMSIGDSSTLQWFDVRINRLTELPSNFSDNDYSSLNIEFNFIDMSTGSRDRGIIDATVCTTKNYKRQLMPVADIVVVPSSNSIMLSWQPGQAGSSGDAEWEVEGYVVYQYDGDMIELASLDAATLEYTHTGLTPETEYSYRVGVDYRVDYSSIAFTNRGYTAANATTLSVETIPTTDASVSPLDSSISTSSPLSEVTLSPPAVDDTILLNDDTTLFNNDEIKNGDQELPLWAIIVICVLGALLLGAGGTITALLLKKNREKDRKAG